MEPIERSQDMITIRDFDAEETIRIGKTKEMYVDENESIRNEVSSDFIMTDGKIIRSVEDFGPQCGRKDCSTRLARTHYECHRCEIPLCKQHAKKWRGERYCRFCRRIEILKSAFWWLVSLLRRKRENANE